MTDNNFFKKTLEPNEPRNKYRATEDYYAQNIDNSRDNEIFFRKDNEPNSLSYYWNQINKRNGIPLSEEEQKSYYLLLMDNIKFDNIYFNKVPFDKDYVESMLTREFKTQKENPLKFSEQLLERVYASCLVESLKTKDVICGGGDDEISLENYFKTHFYDLNKRQVQQILSIVDERYPEEKFNLGLGVQWGHEKTSYQAIKNRISYIVSGIVDYNSMTEICYTEIEDKKDQKMPKYMPFVIVGGDIKNITSLIDKVMKGDFSDISRSSIIYNTLIQIKTQIDLFYQIALKQKNVYSKIPANLSERDRINFINMGDRISDNTKVFESIKSIIDQVVEANEPLIKKATQDLIHKKILSACMEIAEDNNIKF